MTFIDTHCHIHDEEFYPDSREDVYARSVEAGVFMIVVGTDMKSSYDAVAFARSHPESKAVVGVHPHEASHGIEGLADLIANSHDVIVGVGEIGLDYFYEHSTKVQQQDILRQQLALAQEHNLPVSFHVRDAFDDFWPIFDKYKVKGVLHSFTDTAENLVLALERGLYIGVNGISTFTKDAKQKVLYTELPLASIVLETDAPFLTPAPFRGKINTPAYVGRVAEHQAMVKGTSLQHVALVTSQNARKLFGL
jgi:TatD DNase family protein